MYKYIFYIIFIYTLISSISAQEIYLGKYRTTENPHYWKNKLPKAGYWQQDVSYKIKARLDDQTNIIHGEQELEYWNNSPDTLHEVFFHLYQNAFQPHSYCHSLYEENEIPVHFGQYEKNKLGTEIVSFKMYDNSAELTLDYSILRAKLEKPILPGEKIVFDIQFKTFFDRGSLRRRMKMWNAYGTKHFNGVLWYPRISVYDRKFGWTTDQHLGHEFYGDFGDFYVQLDLPHHYILDATGVLQNRSEVLPDSLRQAIDISNFKDKEWESKPSIIIPADTSKRKVWKFFATNVHDFAWTADPTYRMGEEEWNGIKCVSLVQEPHAAKWQNAANYTKSVIQTYSEDIGMYAYPKMIVADARDGMEYPMLTLDGGADPGYRGLLAHEIGHNWFYGMIGSNETYRAALDEGFTQFLTAWSLEKIDGKYKFRNRPKSWYVRAFKDKVESRYSRAYSKYFRDANKDLDPPLNRHSDDFGGAVKHGGGYGHVYYKTATMLYNLRYTLGDELFLKTMQFYFNRWKIGHPYIEDFRQAVIDYTKMDLNWFFDQWLETSKHIDYKITKIKHKGEGNYHISFRRKGEMQMPIDFYVTDKKNETKAYHVPNKWYIKPTEKEVLPKWEGFGNIRRNYTAKIKSTNGLKDVVIDTSLQLADIYLLNNSKKAPISLRFDGRMKNNAKRDKYELFYRPEIWYNAVDGWKPGINLRGNHMNYYHQFEFTFWYNTQAGQNADLVEFINVDDLPKYNYRFIYSHPIKTLGKLWRANLRASYIDGLQHYKSGVSRSLGKNSYGLHYHFQKREFGENYLPIDPRTSTLLINQENNSFLSFDFKRNYKKKNCYGFVALKLWHTSILSNYDYKYVRLTITDHLKIDRLKLSTRFVGQYGNGTNLPLENVMYLGGANIEEMSNNKFSRSTGIFPSNMALFMNNNAILQQEGGLNVKSANTLNAARYRGTGGIAANAKLYFDRYFNFQPKWIKNRLNIQSYLFVNTAMIDETLYENSFDLSQAYYDLGYGFQFTWKKFWKLEKVKPLTIRVDIPMANNLGVNNTIFVGIGKAL